jgi:hypothetical protein
MTERSHSGPLSRRELVDLYFLEHRAKLIDIAAFLDRCDRAPGGADFRITALLEALDLLRDGVGERTRRVLEKLSDPTERPVESAAGLERAHGAWPGA